VRINRLLLVEPETKLRRQLQEAAGPSVIVDADTGLQTARHRLTANEYDWLVTNVRLQAYNGLHLAYLAKLVPSPIRILIYGGSADTALAREAQLLGAFFEPQASVARSLGGYITADLPPLDRRDAHIRDRRTVFRGGRRRSDIGLVAERVGVRLPSGVRTR
jgi:hypothetical protein